MATKIDSHNAISIEQDNIVIVINLSKDGEHLMEFKQSLLDQVASATVSNGESILVTLDNKYYTAVINFSLYPATDSAGINASSVDQIIKVLPSAQAIVVIIDCDANSWSLLQELWSDRISKECNADVQLVCVYGNSIQPNSEHPNFLWTVREHFEFIPMSEQIDMEDDDSFLKEKFGILRLIEALQTHVWSRIEMKDSSPNKPVIVTEKLNGVDKVNIQHSENKIDSLLDGMNISDELNGEDDSFDTLLGKLMDMRQKADTLEGEERKDFAEKVVNLFMNALPDSEDD